MDTSLNAGVARMATLVLTDLVDSTRKHAEAGDQVTRRMWSEHDRAARQLVREWRGREVGRSDGFLLLFDVCDDALGFALAYHRVLLETTPPMRARVGVHWGEIVIRYNSAEDVAGGATPFEIDGLALPSAARVMAAAQEGQTLLSASAAQALAKIAITRFQIRSHGHWRLKGLPEPIELFEAAPAGVPMLPPADSAKAHRVVLRDGLWQPTSELPHNLGDEIDQFVGREADLQSLAQRLENARLVTLLGTGGIGKTRLAKRYARGWVGCHPGGAWFCDLSAARGPDGIAHAVAQALDLPLIRADPIQQLSAALVARGDCLIVLDNFEQVARHASITLGAWLQAVGTARFLVTSREVLGIPGEHVQVLAPLISEDAQALFCSRVRDAGMEEALTSADAAMLPELVELLDGLPLAIELAAARARVVPPAELVRRMGERFRLLASRGGRHDRQATMRATLDWSWDLLQESERSGLSQISVFEGGFTLAASEFVVELPERAAPWIGDVLQSLLEKSLLRRLDGRRFDLLRTIQEYAAEKLPPASAAFRRHWNYFGSLSEVDAATGGGIELDNLVVASRRATETYRRSETSDKVEIGAEAVRALVNAAAVLRLRGPFQIARGLAAPWEAESGLDTTSEALVQRVVGGVSAQLGETDKAAICYGKGARLAMNAGRVDLHAQFLALQSDLEVRRGRLEAAAEALRHVPALANEELLSRLLVLNARGNLALGCSDPMLAHTHFSDALALAQNLPDRRWLGGLHGSLGMVAVVLGQRQFARVHLETALRLSDDLGDLQWASNARCNLGVLLLEMDEAVAAREQLDLALRAARDLGHRRLEATTLSNLGLVWQSLGDPSQALRHHSLAVDAALAIRDARLEGQLRGYLGELLGEVGHMQEARACFEAAAFLLKEAHDESAAALLQCQRALCELHLGDEASARTALEEAKRLGVRHHSASNAELSRVFHNAQSKLSQQRSK